MAAARAGSAAASFAIEFELAGEGLAGGDAGAQLGRAQDQPGGGGGRAGAGARGLELRHLALEPGEIGQRRLIALQRLAEGVELGS